MKKLIALLLAMVMILGMTACGSQPATDAAETQAPVVKNEEPAPAAESELVVPSILDIKIGEDYTDLTATIEYFHGRTDREADGTFNDVIADFNKLYPNITVNHSASTNMQDDLIMRITSGDYPTLFRECNLLTPETYADYCVPMGTYDEIAAAYNGVTKVADGLVYGVPDSISIWGFIYNKAVFEEAGITSLPTTFDEFLNVLKTIKENTDAIPLYTNYNNTAHYWFHGADAAVGDPAYAGVTRVNTANPVAEGTAEREFLNLLWNAVANGYTEEDYSTCDWEASKNWINEGKIGCMLVPTWFYAQAYTAGSTPENLAYMAIPTMDGNQNMTAEGSDPHFINANATVEEQIAAMVFYKWFVEVSDFKDNEMQIRANVGAEYPEYLGAMAALPVQVKSSGTAEDAQKLADMKSETENLFASADYGKYLIEAASTGIDTFENIMNDWNQQWSDAQEALGIDAK